MTPADFIDKWRQVELKERAAAQEHFLDLCRLLELPTPAEVDPKGETFTFEKRVSKAAGGRGFADVWKRGHFAWEYKGRGKDLNAAYVQLLLYRDDLENPPLLVVSDIQRILVHTNFTDTTKKIYEIALKDLEKPEARQLLKQVFTDPSSLNPKSQREAITAEATEQIGQIALHLRDRRHNPEHVAHFMMQLVFALFAEDINLLPNRVVSKILEKTGTNPDIAQRYLGELFTAMAQGGVAALEEIPSFNGGLFQGGEVLRLEADELHILHEAAKLDWSEVEPAIFGTLFERSLDPEKRSQLGAHYTSRDDILRIVQPVVMEPLWREWEEIRITAKEHLEAPEHDHAATASRLRRERVDEPIAEFLRKLQTIRVLDPACGSGNFLYIAMQQLKDLEKDVVTFAQGVGAPGYMTVGPKQFYGLELNVFARELTSMVIWIGYLQWNRANGESNQQRPILEKLDNIQLHDALMNEDGTEYGWPEAEFIIGNPPFLGSQLMRSELGDGYVDRLRTRFEDRLPGQSDFVCYWFEKARAHIELAAGRRAGLLATNSIRGGANRQVLKRIKNTSEIFMAWSDEPWILEGAAVRVSIVAFGQHHHAKHLDGAVVADINADLTSGVDLAHATPLEQNAGRAFQGPVKIGAFDIQGEVAREWLRSPNPSGFDNRDVLKPFVNGRDILATSRDRWIVDFGDRSVEEASRYVLPFAHVEENVKPSRMKNKRESRRKN